MNSSIWIQRAVQISANCLIWPLGLIASEVNKMKRTRRIHLAAAYLKVLPFAFVSLMSTAQAAEDTTPATGTFTEQQFERGQRLYADECALCHGDNLDGGVAPSLLGPTFRKAWSRIGANVGELYNRIATTMPPGNWDYWMIPRTWRFSLLSSGATMCWLAPRNCRLNTTISALFHWAGVMKSWTSLPTMSRD